MRTAKRTGYQRPAKHKRSEKQDDRFLAMVCFQMALCILAAAVFFAACRGEQGESDSAVYKTAQLLCGQQSERLIDWESLRGQDWLQKIKDFWQGGAAELLERLQKLISSQLVPPEELPPETIGESGAGGPLPAYSLSADGLPAAEGTTLAPYFLTASMWSPVSGLVTSRFGWRSHPVSGQDDFHTGVDIAAAQGTPILAALPGVVEQTGYSESYGNFVVLRHSDNLRTTYNHCSEILAKEGEQLARGDRIALVGSTGISTGPHLHFEVEVKGLKADPLQALEVTEYEVSPVKPSEAGAGRCRSRRGSGSFCR